MCVHGWEPALLGPGKATLRAAKALGALSGGDMQQSSLAGSLPFVLRPGLPVGRDLQQVAAGAHVQGTM